MDIPNTTKCAACGKLSAAGSDNFQRCSGCKSVSYCSVDCQRLDWKKAHKRQCKITAVANKAQAVAATHIGDSVAGVRLKCAKEGVGVEHVDIPSHHPIFDGPVIEIPALMEIPLVIHRLGTQSTNQPDLDCQLATWLMIKYEDGFAPPQWQSDVGSCWLARKDKKSLSEQQVYAIHDYMSTLLDRYSDDPKDAQKLITRKAFERWFEQYVQSMVEVGGSEWKDFGSLYEL